MDIPFILMVLLQVMRLLTQAKFFNDGTVAVDVAIVQVVEQRTAFTYQHSQSSFSAIIFYIAMIFSKKSSSVCYF